jgi:hypothetical protein
LKNFETDGLDKILYKEPVPIIPFPHKSKKVMPDGFIRDQPNLA